MSAIVNVSIVDDHAILAETLARCLGLEDDIQVSGHHCSAQDFQTEFKPDPNGPNIVILDLNLKGESGFQVLKWLTRHHPSIGIVILTMHNNAEYVRRCISAGAKAYIVKDSGTDEIISAVRTVSKGGMYFSPGVVDSARSIVTGSAKPLSDQELNVISHLRNGAKNKEIAKIMGLSVRTIETHRRNIKIKLSANNTAEIIEYAIRNDI